MRGLGRLLLAALAAWLAAFGAALADETDHQVLVMLRMAPEHFRAGAAYAGGYGDGASRASRQRAADRLAREHGLARVTDWPMPLLGVDCFVMQAPEGRAPADVAAELGRDRAVAWSEPMQTYRAQAAPNDPLFPLQPAAQAWRLAELRGVATGRGVRVAVIDSAVDAAHPDLTGQVRTRQDFVAGHPGAAELHGTGVAGVIAALADNRLGMAGVAPGARLMALRACWQKSAADTICDTLSLAKALSFAIEGDAQVINLSLGGPSNLLLGRLIDVALARGAVVVAAVDPALAGGGFPASHRGVVAVTAGPAAPGTFAAPGRDVPTTQPGGKFGLVNGSSYAAAHVSGLFALLREHSPRGGAALLLAGAGGAVDACATLHACGGQAPLAARALPIAR
jgi:subtilisin family serine protease